MMKKAEQLLYEICESKNLTLMESINYLYYASKIMRKTDFTVDSPEMKAVVESVFGIQPKYTEALWELTETPHFFTFIGKNRSGLELRLSVEISCELEELKKFYDFVGRTIYITNTEITGGCL